MYCGCCYQTEEIEPTQPWTFDIHVFVSQPHQISCLVIFSISFQYEVSNIGTISSGLRHRGLGATPKPSRKTCRRSYKSNCANNLDCRRLYNCSRWRSQRYRRLGSISPILFRRQRESEQLRLCRTIRAFGASALSTSSTAQNRGQNWLTRSETSSHAKAVSTE